MGSGGGGLRVFMACLCQADLTALPVKQNLQLFFIFLRLAKSDGLLYIVSCGGLGGLIRGFPE